MIRTEKRLRLCRALLILNLTFIWGNSLLPGETSAAFSDWVKGLLLPILPEGLSSGGGGGLLRKVAHFTEFAALGMCLKWLLSMLEKKAWTGIIWGGMAACVDEMIQIFVPGRGPGIKDVGIDVLGVCTGIFLLCFGHTLLKSIKNISFRRKST